MAIGLLGATLGSLLVLGPVDGPASALSGQPGADASYAGDGMLDLDTAASKLAVDPQGRLLVLDDAGPSGHRLRRFSAEGALDSAFGSVALPAGTVSRSEVTLLADGTISIVDQDSGSSRPNTLTVVRVEDDGTLDPGYGTGGAMVIDRFSEVEAYVQLPDGSVLVEGISPYGTVRLEQFGADGQPDPGFDGDGVLSLVCCGATPEPQLADLAPHGTGAVALLRQRTETFVAPIGSDGTVGAATALPVSGYAYDLLALPDGTFLVSTRAGQSEYSDFRSYRIGADLAVIETFGQAGSIGTGRGVVQAVAAGGRILLLSNNGQTARVVALDATGIDETYGSGGSVTVVEPPDPSDSVRLSTRNAAALAPDGRLLMVGAYEWGPGFFNPYYARTSVVDAFDADGRRLHRWTFDGIAVATGSMVAEPTGPGFLLRSGLGASSYVQRWVPPTAGATLGPVRDAAATVDQDTARVTWNPPEAAPGLLIERYRLEVFAAGAATPAMTREPADPGVSITFPETAAAYRVVLTPMAAGDRAGPATELLVIPPLPSVPAFVDRLSRDFSGRAATPAEQASAATVLATGAADPAYLVRAAGQTERWRTTVDPVVRLYSAYFQRTPDPAGLRYWTARRVSGTTIAKISATFAASNEFKRTYGPLTDRAFVELVYRNVLGRTGDPGGVAYWTTRLTNRSTSRGQLMASFSESSEHVRRRSMLVDTVSLYWGMLGRLPDAGERQYWAGPGSSRDASELATALLTSGDYLARFGRTAEVITSPAHVARLPAG